MILSQSRLLAFIIYVFISIWSIRTRKEQKHEGKKGSLFLSAWTLGFLQMSIPVRKRPDSEVRAWCVCATGHDITSVFDEPRATATAQYNQICHNFKCVGIYNLHLPHCEYVAVAALLCGHLSLTGVINSIFVDSAASDSHDSTFHH